MKKSLGEISKMSLTEVEENLRESASFRYIKEKEYARSEREAMEVSSAFTTLLKLAWLDRELTNKEVRYLLRETGDWCKLEDDQRKELIDVHSALVRKNVKFANYINFHIDFLSRSFDDQEKHHFFEALVVISRSDLDVAKLEESFLGKVAKAFKLDQKFISETIMNGKFIASTRMEKAQLEAKPDDEEVHEIPDISFDW